MPDTAEILARPDVQKAIGALVHDAARLAGISLSHAEGIRMSILGRLEEGAPIQPAIDLVDVMSKAIRDADDGADMKPRGAASGFYGDFRMPLRDRER